MRALVVHAHPSEASFSAAVRDAAVRGLEAAGHEVRVRRLGPEGFRATMTADERAAYHGVEPVIDPVVAEHVDDVRWAEHLVFVYPTWWSGLPAQLKGWFDRVLVPGVAFTFHPATGRVRPGLTQVRRLTGVTTHGSPRLDVWMQADGGRRTVLRTLRLSCHPLARSNWLAMYGLDASTPEERAAFLERVEGRLARPGRRPIVPARRSR